MKLKYIRKFFFACSILLFILLVLFVSALLLLQRPNTQTYVVNKVLNKIEKQYDTNADIESVHLKFPTSLVLKGFYLEDQNKDTLVYARELNASFSFLQPLKRKVHVSKLKLDGAKINLSKKEGEDYNFQFFLENEQKDKKQQSNQAKKPFNYQVYSIEFNDTHLSLKDENNFTVAPAYLNQLKINIEDFNAEQKSVIIHNALVDGLNVTYSIHKANEAEKEVSLNSFFPGLDWNITTKEFEVKNSNFHLINPYAKKSELPIDFNNLQLKDINTKIENIKVDSTISMKIADLSLHNGDLLNIKEFYTYVTISDKEIDLDKLGLKFNNSSLKLDAKLTVNDFNKFPDYFYQNSHIKAYIAANDANLFLPNENKIEKGISLDIHSTGNLKRLNIQDINLQSADIKVAAHGHLRELLNPAKTNFDLEVDHLVGSAEQIQQTAPWINLPEQVVALGNTVVTGNVSGTTKAIIADVVVNSDIGEIDTKINIDASGKDLVYTGEIAIPTIDIQKILPNAPIGKAKGTIQLNGKGTEIAGLKGDINAVLEYIELNGYTYKNVNVKGNIKDQIFNGYFDVDDKNLALEFDGTLDMADSLPKIKSHLNIKNADLQALKLYKKPLQIALNGAVDITGDDLSNLNGTMNLSSLHIENDSNAVDFDSTLFLVRSEPNFKAYDIISNKMEVHVEGDYDPIVLTKELQRYFTDYVYYLNYTDTTQVVAQNIKGNISIAEEFGLVKFLLGTVEIPEKIEAEFEFNNVEEVFNVHAHSPHIGYKKFGIDTFLLSAYTDENELILDAEFGQLSANNNKINIDLVDFFAKSTKNSIDARIDVEDEDAPNRFSLSPQIDFLEDSIQIHFNNSYFKLNNALWPFTSNNEIIFSKDEIIANNFAIQNENQYLQIVNASSDLSDALIEFHNLDIPSLANIAQLDTVIRDGLLTGRVKLSDPLKDMKANVDLSFAQLQVFDYYCDSLSIDAFYDKAKNNIDVGAIFNDPNYDLFATGNYDLTKGKVNPADIDIKINRLSLSFLDLILKDEAQFNIFAEGDLKFTGSVFKPVLLGEGYVLDTASVYIKFLGTDLIIMPENGVKEKVIFTENTMDFQSINVLDPFGNRAYMEGKLTHFNFKDMSVDARLITDHFNMLNTTSHDNDDFYGIAFGEGKIGFSGLTKNINMDIDVKTKKGTYVSIPIVSIGDTKEYNFTFINPFEALEEKIKKEEIIEIKGVNMNFDLEVTPDAELELVLNPGSDNNLKARGNGKLQMRINQNKQLSIYGKYNLIDGDYVFSPQNLLNKKFKIKNGSSIEWNGKPFGAALDVDALYKVDARVDNLLQDSTVSSQNVPMDVVIHIGGTLNETDVSFDIEPRRSSIYASIDEVESFLDEIKNDEGELTTQAISLLLVKRFLPSNSTVFTGTSFSAGEFGKTTALELVSNQVSNYLTDAISKLITEVEFNFNIIQREDYSTDEPGQTTTMQLDYTQKFVNNRLIINIGGNFEFQDPNSTQENTIAGDFEVEGLLTEDGKLRAKAFHRTADYDIFNQDRSQTGVSISYQKDFDKISEVFTPDANKKNKRSDNRDKRRSDRENRRFNKKSNTDAIKEEDNIGG